jgi:pimeloyl-ACP methyl ester carboxylesterase
MSQPRTGIEDVNGVRLAYRHWTGPSHAQHPPVILLHGVLQSGEGMRHLAEQLSLDREVLVPDLRGRGNSDRPQDGYDPATMAGDVAGLIDRLGIERPALIGRLHGGLVAYQLAARRPELVCGVVLGDANPEVTADRASQALAAVSALPEAFASLADATRFYEEGLGLPPDRARHDIPSDLEAMPDGGYRWRHDLDVVRQIEAAAIPRSGWDVLAQLRCPVLILRGQRGEIRPETAERMLATRPRARAQTIYGASHDVFLGPGSEQTLAAIQLFLFGLDGGLS